MSLRIFTLQFLPVLIAQIPIGYIHGRFRGILFGRKTCLGINFCQKLAQGAFFHQKSMFFQGMIFAYSQKFAKGVFKKMVMHMYSTLPVWFPDWKQDRKKSVVQKTIILSLFVFVYDYVHTKNNNSTNHMVTG